MSEPSPAVPERETFVGWVHDALNHLYDTHHLNRHPLADLLVGTVPDPSLRSQMLRRLLVDAIRALRPASGTPAQSPDWRGHHILELRYIEGLSPAEAMERLALSKSHYFREQARIVEAVADILWAHAPVLDAAAPQVTQPAELGAESSLASASRSELAQAEVERLCAQATWETVDAAPLVASLRPVIASLAAANGITLHMAEVNSFAIARGNRPLLRQSLLNVVSYALDMAHGGILYVESLALEGETGLAIRAHRPAPQPAPEKRRQGVGLEIARRLIEAMHGRLMWTENSSGWEARLVWPTTVRPLLLVVDDNRSFIDLIRRYLTGTAWEVLGASSGQEARAVLADHRPSMILLDVMMPDEDGWELLRVLRSSDPARDTQIIICSVLNEPQLARMLGADGYLPKPVSPQALARALPVLDASPASAP